MTDTERLNTLEKLLANPQITPKLEFDRIAGSYHATCMFRTGYGSDVRQAIDALVLRLHETLSDRVLNKILLS